MRGVRMRVLVALAALAVLAAACGSDSNDSGAGGATGATAATGATDSGSGDDPGAGSLYGGSNGMTGATGATGANADVSVSLNNYLFDPATVTVPKGLMRATPDRQRAVPVRRRRAYSNTASGTSSPTAPS